MATILSTTLLSANDAATVIGSQTAMMLVILPRQIKDLNTALASATDPTQIASMNKILTSLQNKLVDSQTTFRASQVTVLTAQAPPVSVPNNAMILVQNNGDGTTSLVVTQ